MKEQLGDGKAAVRTGQEQAASTSVLQGRMTIGREADQERELKVFIFNLTEK